MNDEMQENIIPCFIENRGCINCDASKERKNETGFSFGYHHTLMFACLGGNRYGIDLTDPFLDPEKAVRLAKEDGSQEAIKGARDYCLHVKEVFGEHYKKMGTDLDNIINSLGDVYG